MSENGKLNLKLVIWRQPDAETKGDFVTYELGDISPHMSFLEMLDVLNEDLLRRGDDPVAFDSDCREGICGTCGVVINGVAHGSQRATTVCQLHMRNFNDGDTVVIEPFRARPFAIVKDLVVDRAPFDRIIQSGGFISVNTGSPQDANSILIPKTVADEAMDSAACIGCGACVAACPNASASLFVGAKISHLTLLPQGHPESKTRAAAMVAVMDREGFGSCSNHAECEAVCPKEISISNIARMRREYVKAVLK